MQLVTFSEMNHFENWYSNRKVNRVLFLSLLKRMPLKNVKLKERETKVQHTSLDLVQFKWRIWAFPLWCNEIRHWYIQTQMGTKKKNSWPQIMGSDQDATWNWIMTLPFKLGISFFTATGHFIIEFFITLKKRRKKRKQLFI